MAKIIFGDDLKDKIKSRHPTRTSKQPFSAWLVKPIKIKSKKYYLYIEQSTKLAIVAKFLNQNKFHEALDLTLSDITCITDFQVDDVSHVLSNLTYSYEKDVTDDYYIQEYQKILNDIPNSEFKKMKKANGNDQVAEAYSLSSYLIDLAETDTGMPITSQFLLKLNEEFPISTKKPKKNVKYIDIKAKFTDPRSWEKFDKIIPGSAIAKQLEKNNLQIIKQFRNSSFFKQSYKTNHVFTALEAFLNMVLISYLGRPVTKNLADAVMFVETNTDSKYDNSDLSPEAVDSLYSMFIDFYKFLYHTGTIRKADAERAELILNKSYHKVTGKYLDEKFAPNPEDSTLTQMILDFINKQSPKDLDKLLNSGSEDFLKDNNFNKLITDYQKHEYGLPETELENKDRNNKTYEIRAKLKGFKPSTWRRFRISGSASVATLQKATIAMFNGTLFGHMYDLYNNKTQEVYEIPEFHDEDFDFGPTTIDATKAKVSGFNLNQKFVITYDFGDNWEFEITIKKIIDEKPSKHPVILSGKGYGIIEDIGGIWELTDYYNDNLDPEMEEEFGDVVDLDEFDLDGLNEMLKRF